MTETTLTVSQLNQRVKAMLETQLGSLVVEGELSNFAQPSSGHWYFTIKDAGAQVRCAMFRGRNRLLQHTPAPGDKVRVRALVSLYEGRGDYQLIAEHMEPAGLGDLQAQFEFLKNKLHNEGLFADEHKRDLPDIPTQIGLITSPTGAAVQDILNVLKRRFPAVPVTLIPTAVQGNRAAVEIAQAIELANRQTLCDLLIIGRGGGSLEDLWAFNEEIVARALFASGIPCISAVGHEIDHCIADFVADLRAPTPSAAAEIAVPDQQALFNKLEKTQSQFVHLVRRHLSHNSSSTISLAKRLKSPKAVINAQNQRLDHLEFRLKGVIKQTINSKHSLFSKAHSLLSSINPQAQIKNTAQRLLNLQQELKKTIQYKLFLKRQNITHQSQLLNHLSPLVTLERGYAIVKSKDGKIVRKASEAPLGTELSVRLSEGELLCRTVQKQ